MILVHSGVDVDPETLVDAVYNPGRGGSLAPAVLAAARRSGRTAYPINSLKDIFEEVDDGRPVLVLQNLGLQWIPRWHYAVVVGYDLSQNTIVLHSGTTPFYRTDLATFERTWRRGEYWGLTVLRPGEFPAGADPHIYLNAVAGVERAGRKKTAALAYAAAVQRWPENPVAHLANGNAQYALGNREAAAAAFRRAVTHGPDMPDAHNNLAHVLLELGHLEEAEGAVTRAIELGGRNIETYRETLRGIIAARKRRSRVAA